MKQLRKWVNKLARHELADANEHKPLFASDHEGLAIIDEELTEAEACMEIARGMNYNFLRRSIFEDADWEEKREYVSDLEKNAIEAACEMIQVAAMCQKFRMSHKEVKEEFPQEYADALTELNLTKEEKDKFVVKAPSFVEFDFEIDADSEPKLLKKLYGWEDKK